MNAPEKLSEFIDRIYGKSEPDPSQHPQDGEQWEEWSWGEAVTE
jgi:hypothetical protein